MAKVMKVQKDFRKPGLSSRLTKMGGKRPVLYSFIRFASASNAIDSFLNNLNHMKQISANDDISEDECETKNPDPAVTQLIFNSNFIESVKNLLSLLNPIAEVINVCQKSNVSLADGVEKWLDLLNNSPEELKELVKARCKKCKVFNEISLSANYFHPIYRGKKLSVSQRRVADDFIFDKLEANGLESCRLFVNEEGTFAGLKRKNIMSINTYWYYASKRGHPELGKFAKKLLKIPASTAQLE